MAGSKDSLRDRLARYYRQIKMSVTGRKSGRTISIPVLAQESASRRDCYKNDPLLVQSTRSGTNGS